MRFKASCAGIVCISLRMVQLTALHLSNALIAMREDWKHIDSERSLLGQRLWFDSYGVNVLPGVVRLDKMHGHAALKISLPVP